MGFELSVWLDIDGHTKNMQLNFLILDDDKEIEIGGEEQIKQKDGIYFEFQNISMYQLKEFLFFTN